MAWIDCIISHNCIIIFLTASIHIDIIRTHVLGYHRGQSWDVSISTFNRVWDEHFSDVIIPKSHRFSKCDTCVQLKADLHGRPLPKGIVLSEENKRKFYEQQVCWRKKYDMSLNTFKFCGSILSHGYVYELNIQLEKKIAARELFSKHMEEIRKERGEVMRLRQKSITSNGELFFFQIDGMDQSKTLLPHFVNPPKGLDKSLLFDYHLTCVKCVRDPIFTCL